MPSTAVINAPEMTVGVLRSKESGEVLDPVLSLNFPTTFFDDLCQLLMQAPCCPVLAGMKTEGSVAKITVAIIINTNEVPGTIGRYILVCEIDQDISSKHFAQFMDCFRRSGQFAIKLAEMSSPDRPDADRRISSWGIHLPEFDPHMEETIGQYLP